MVLPVALAMNGRNLKFENNEIAEPSEAEEKISADVPRDNWDMFIEAVIWKESRGVEDCIGDSGKAVGVLQIHPIMVREANRILSIRGEKKNYAYDDRYSREKSIAIFKIVQDYHNASHSHEKALEIWNKNHPRSYYTQIMDKYNELIS
jgi:hypothetical protein